MGKWYPKPTVINTEKDIWGVNSMEIFCNISHKNG